MKEISRRITPVVVGLTVASFILAGCSSTSAPAGSAAVASGTPKCVPDSPQALPKDPDGVLGSLTTPALDALKGYGGTVFASPWKDFKPKNPAPWTVGFSGNESNAANVLMQSGVQEVIDANPTLFKKQVISVTASPANDAASQIQGMQTLLQKGVDIILAPLSSPTALNGVIDQAAAKGVPVISILGQSTDKNAINIQPNPTQAGYDGAAGVVTQMGDKGDVIMVHGIPGLSIDTDIYNAAKKVFDACPGIKVTGELTGNFDPATAKSETLKFLTTHPGTISGAFNVSNMASGIISAFQQTGRPVPPVADVAANGAALAYWRDHPQYKGVGVSLQSLGTARFGMAVGMAMLQGRGVKITEVTFSPSVITSKNLSQWVKKEWNSSTNTQADGPDSAIPTQSLIDSYFLNK